MSRKKTRATRPQREITSPLGGSGEVGSHPLVAIAATALALGFYFWTVSGPMPMPNTEMHIQDLPLFTGLPTALGCGLAAAALLGLAMYAITPLRARRSGVVLAAAGLYLSAGLPAIGNAAILLAPVGVGALGWIELRKPRPLSGSFLLALHAGAFVSALGFYHDWARYAYGWQFFVSNLSALGKLLL